MIVYGDTDSDPCIDAEIKSSQSRPGHIVNHWPLSVYNSETILHLYWRVILARHEPAWRDKKLVRTMDNTRTHHSSSLNFTTMTLEWSRLRVGYNVQQTVLWALISPLLSHILLCLSEAAYSVCHLPQVSHEPKVEIKIWNERRVQGC